MNCFPQRASLQIGGVCRRPRYTEQRERAQPPSRGRCSYLFFNVEGMEVVIVSEFGPSGHVPQGIQSDPVHAVDRPAGRTRGGDGFTAPRAASSPCLIPVLRLLTTLSSFNLPPPTPSLFNAVGPIVLRQFSGKHALRCQVRSERFLLGIQSPSKTWL